MRCFVLLSACFLLSCGPQKPGANTSGQASLVADTSRFYPLENFLDQEISFVELRPMAVNARWQRGQAVVQSSLSTSAWVDSIRPLKAFLDQYWKGHKDQFQESSFEDLGTERTVFDYLAKDKSYPLQQLTVQADNRTQQIKTLYWVVAEKRAIVGTVVHRITWQAQTRLQWVRWHKDQADSLSETLSVQWKKALQP